MVNWWDENVIFPRYAHDWWFIGGIVLAVVFGLLVGYASSVAEEKREKRLLDIEQRLTKAERVEKDD